MNNSKLTYKVFQDTYFDKNYLDNWLDEIGAVFLYKSHHYEFAGINVCGDMVDFLLDLLEFTDKQVDILDKKCDGIYNNEALFYLVERFFGNLHHKVYIYDHSGVSISTTPFMCSWDSGVLGVIGIVDKDKYKKAFGLKRINTNKALERLENWIKELNHYVTGNCWGFAIENENGDIVDSCDGFVGDFENVVSDMAETADTPDELEVIKQKLLEAYDNLC